MVYTQYCISYQHYTTRIFLSYQGRGVQKIDSFDYHHFMCYDSINRCQSSESIFPIFRKAKVTLPLSSSDGSTEPICCGESAGLSIQQSHTTSSVWACMVHTGRAQIGARVNLCDGKVLLPSTQSTQNWKFWKWGWALLGWQHTGVLFLCVWPLFLGQGWSWRYICWKNYFAFHKQYRLIIRPRINTLLFTISHITYKWSLSLIALRKRSAVGTIDVRL